MGHPLSMDLRSRLLAAIDEGLSCRAAAARFGVSPSTAIRWETRRRETGSFASKPQGGDVRSHRVEERAADILALWEARKDISLEELRGKRRFGPTLRRFLGVAVGYGWMTQRQRAHWTRMLERL